MPFRGLDLRWYAMLLNFWANSATVGDGTAVLARGFPRAPSIAASTLNSTASAPDVVVQSEQQVCSSASGALPVP
eukprot:CAMPEP_0115065788 /NCGR_PEP_ID=MMETSP0227-20121206/10452_1 /TAXON_ID=89957 /ORGANISM="Polarella glacialis, Strain CCMP 1383" /LENGTH=74 /DNA_ID=CAMNT_0002451629 /DNA_START=226 /DNA_END=447 /DNA_ORIENTATION=+